MRTEILDISTPIAIDQAALRLDEGHLVAFPTDTLYGLGAAARNSNAIDRLFQVKRRPVSKGIPILISELHHLESIVERVPDWIRPLLDRYWPGPLTLIMFKREGLPEKLSPNDGVAVRMPDHHLARRFIEAVGGAIAATSANLSGQEPALTAQGVQAALGDKVAVILDGGPVKLGQASTILDIRTMPPRLIRSGPVVFDHMALEKAGRP